MKKSDTKLGIKKAETYTYSNDHGGIVQVFCAFSIISGKIHFMNETKFF